MLATLSYAGMAAHNVNLHRSLSADEMFWSIFSTTGSGFGANVQLL